MMFKVAAQEMKRTTSRSGASLKSTCSASSGLAGTQGLASAEGEARVRAQVRARQKVGFSIIGPTYLHGRPDATLRTPRTIGVEGRLGVIMRTQQNR